MVYVSMTGFRPKGLLQLPAFWWRTIRAMNQARSAPGNISVKARLVGGTYHTMTTWSDAASVRAYVSSGAHLAAMKGFRKLGTGRTYGCSRDDVPEWEIMYGLWRQHGREV